MRQYDQACPIARTLDVVGDRWTLLVLREMFLGETRFSDLRAGAGGMPARVLSARLKSLAAAGFIERRLYQAHPPRAEYHLTERGRSFAPVMEAVVNWGVQHALSEEERPEVLNRVRARLQARPELAGTWTSAWVHEPQAPGEAADDDE
ncbi:MAG: helix-turn-helix transcriptional regulator [Chloroflexi bacterium]|nr:helix-turn-helix transcriptional regulator [Chloroflexota bacterium]